MASAARPMDPAPWPDLTARGSRSKLSSRPLATLAAVGAIALRPFYRLVDGCSEGDLRFRQCRALCFGGIQIPALRDWLGFGDLAGAVIDQHFRELPLIRSVDR